MTNQIFLSSLKVALEKALGISVEVQDIPGNIIAAFKRQEPLSLCLHIDAGILQSHQEIIGGEIATVVDDFKIISAKLTQEREKEPCQI